MDNSITGMRINISDATFARKFIKVYELARNQQWLTKAEFPMWEALSIYLKIVKRTNTAELTTYFMEKYL